MAFAALALMGLSACQDEKASDGVTRITYYPILTIEGESSMLVDKGTAYVEPGYAAELNGNDVTDEVVVSSNVDVNTSGIYAVTYSIANEDGFSSTVTREVIVLDASDPYEGIYMTDPNNYRLYNGAQVKYGAAYQIKIIGQGNGVYYVDDLLGGWYCQRYGYGTNYAMQAYIQVDAGGNFTLLQSYVPGWDDTAEFLQDGKFDNGTVSYMVEYTTYLMDFYVTMYKQ